MNEGMNELNLVLNDNHWVLFFPSFFSPPLELRFGLRGARAVSLIITIHARAYAWSNYLP